ncbi:hypothetical protein RDWZM_004139, partial [Blomia tropicalis]
MDKFLVYTTANTNDTETYKHKEEEEEEEEDEKTGNKTRQTEVINLELQAIYPKRDSEEEGGE